jgi:hypothetical protein
MENKMSAHKNLVGKPLEEWSLGGHTRRRKGNIKMVLDEICCEGGIWTELAQNKGQ